MSRFYNNYFLFFYSILPISLILGSAISLVNILIIDLSFLVYIFFKKDFSFIKNKNFKYLIILYIYLIFNSLTSINPSEGLYRNLGFIRIIIFFISINYFFYEDRFLKKVFFIWFIIILIVALDVYIESFSGKNILGYGGRFGGKGGSRIVSFFKDEPIVGGYLFAFILIIIGFFNKSKFLKNEYFNLIIIFFFLLAIILTGERSNTVRTVLGVLVIFLLMREFSFKKKIIILLSSFVILTIIILNSQFLKLRFVDQIKNLKKDNIYFNIYNSGFEVFKKYPILGTGNKNYRVETCNNVTDQKNNNYICQTHPHQIYLELLSEHGLVGSMIIFYLMYKLIFSKILNTLRDKNSLQIGSLVYLLLTFLPILPSGAFFSDYMLTLFSINLSIFYAVNKKTNIFKVS